MQSSSKQIGGMVTRLAVTHSVPEQAFVELKLTELTAAPGLVVLPPTPVIESVCVVELTVEAFESPEESSLVSPPMPVVS